MAQTDAIIICNEALVLIGEEPIENLTGATAAHVAANLLYQATVDDMLASHPWHWNRDFTRLSRLTEAPNESVGFSAAYSLPVDQLRIICPFVNTYPVTDWQPGEQVIWLDAGVDDTVDLEYHRRVDEARFSRQFRTALVHSLAGQFCVPIRDDRAMREGFLKMAEMQMAKARHQNATERPAQRMGVGTFERLMRS